MNSDSQLRGGAALPASDGSAIPRALFSCSNEYCREEVSYHADQLYWHAAEKRWVCENCWDNLDGRPPRGITLAEHIIGGDFKAVTLLQNEKAHPTAAKAMVERRKDKRNDNDH